MIKIKIILLFFYLFGVASVTFIEGQTNQYIQTYKDSLIELETDWQFHFGNFLSTSRFRKLPSTQTIAETQSWNTISNHKYPSWGIATYYKRIIIQRQKRTFKPTLYGMRVGTIMCAYKLYVNDLLIGSMGNIGSAPSQFSPYILPTSYYFATKSDTLDIIIHVSNFFNRNYAGIVHPLYFGSSQEITTLTKKRELCSLAMTITLFLLFAYQFILCFFTAHRKIHIALALLTLFLLCKAFVEGDVRIFSFFPDTTATTMCIVWALSLLSIPSVFYLATLYFRNAIPSIVDKFVYTIYSIYILIVFFVNEQIQHYSIWVFVFLSGCLTLYILFILIKGIFQHQNFAVLHSCSMFFFLIALTHQLISASVLHIDTNYALLMSILFIALQTIITIIKQSKAQQQVQDLTQELSLINQSLEQEIKLRTSDLRASNKELAEVNKQKDFLISTISHDLMNDFNKLLFHSRTLLKEAQDDDKIRKRSTTILQAAKKGYNILETILYWEKIKHSYLPQRETIKNLNSIITENIELEQDSIIEKKLEISLKIDNNLWFQCDRSHLNTILRNLISNAIKFSNIQGAIHIFNRKKSNYVQIIVQDNGIGISEALCDSVLAWPHIIQSQGTKGECGNGVGLAITKDMVESNDGRLKCKSLSGELTQFIVEFKLISK